MKRGFVVLILALGLILEPVPARSETRTVCGREFVYYAQNVGAWADAVYEYPGSKGKRRFGWGGCNPTSLAMAVANLVSLDKLPAIAGYSYKGAGFRFSERSVYSRRGVDGAVMVATPGDFLAYLPAVMGAYAAGNSEAGRVYRGDAGTSARYFGQIADIYGLSLRSTRSLADMYAGLESGAVVVALAAKGYGPLTDVGHYVFIPCATADALYVFDPLLRPEYEKDKAGIIEQPLPGVLKVKRDDVPGLHLIAFYIFNTDAPGR